MAFRFSRKDRSTEKALRRIAVEQIDGAIAAINELERAEAVHDIRRRCKRLRALVRLVRPGFADHRRENAEFREIAALISGVRDAKVMLDTLDGLARHCPASADSRNMESVRLHLAENCGGTASDHLEALLEDVRDRLVKARARARHWQLQHDGWPALSRGLARCLDHSCRAALAADAQPDMESFHNLRKRIKDHWYHCHLLAQLWPAAMAVREREAGELGELLGDHHDLAMLAARLGADLESIDDRTAAEQAIGLASKRRLEIERQAWPMIERLLAQSPAQLGQSWGRLWAIWRDEGILRDRLAGK